MNQIKIKKFAIQSTMVGSVSYGIGDTRIGGDGCIYKYMTIHSASLCFQDKNIMFQEPSMWQDKYEARFYNADYSNLGNPEWVNNKVYACCFTKLSQNEAAWKVYASSKGNDDQKYCLQIRIRRTKLREMLNQYAKNHDMQLYEGLIDYKQRHVIDHLHERQIIHKDGTIEDHGDYKYYFENFSWGNYLRLLLIKRKAFQHEKEIRFFLVPNNHEGIENEKDKESHSIFPDIDWCNLIEDIYIDYNAPDYLVKYFKDSCAENGIDADKIHQFNIYGMTEDTPIVIDAPSTP